MLTNEELRTSLITKICEVTRGVANPDEDSLSEDQRKVVSVIKGEDFGCYQKQVAKLASALSGISMEFLIKDREFPIGFAYMRNNVAQVLHYGRNAVDASGKLLQGGQVRPDLGVPLNEEQVDHFINALDSNSLSKIVRILVDEDSPS